jgi:hypothetical protein
MTLSNFDWTDKTSVKWFIMLPTGHEGPYSLLSLIKRKISPEVKVWAEGLSSSVLFKIAVKNSQEIIKEDVEVAEDEIPPIPVITEEVEIIPPLPEVETTSGFSIEVPVSKIKIRIGLIVGLLLVIILD